MNDLNICQEFSEHVTCTHKSGYADVTKLYHKHNNYEIYLLLNGEVNFYLEEYGYHMEKGSILFIRPDVFHRLEYLNPVDYERVNIHIKSWYFKTLNTAHTNLADVLSNHGNGSYVSFLLPQQQIDKILEKSCELERSLHWEQFGDDILSECLLKEILLILNKLPRNHQFLQKPKICVPRLVSDIIAYISENLTEDLSVNALAAIFHRNGQYLSRRFREFMGVPLQQYILHKRVDLARKYLEDGVTLSQVCMDSGFHDYANFSKLFTKYVGMAPKQYQMQAMAR
ncbi:MAG: helix-turn-helix transcriptional regulator [Lachnospiraceae bacterium]|nr:helix-turn-helix transcriptional regulator [Lachnospiraceae bacterium]